MNSAEREGKSPAKTKKTKSPPSASPEDSAGHTQVDMALSESESRYRTVFESTGTAMVIIEEDTTIGFANKEFFRLTGYSQEDIDARKRWTEFVHRDDREKMIARHTIRRKRPEDTLRQYEFRLITKSGEIRNILLTIDMFPGTQRSIASLIDVTDKKRVEDALTASESRLRGIVRVAPIGIGIVANRVILDVNDQICAMTGYSAEDIIGQSSRVLYPSQEDFEYVGQEKYDQIARKGSGVVETRWQRKEGEIIDILLSSTPLNPPDLSAGVTFTALDITERKRAEKALRQSELQYRNLAETIQDFIITTDFDGIITYANPVAQNLVGGEGLVGVSLKKFMNEEQITRHREMLNSRHKGLSETLSYEWQLKSPKDGSSLLLDVRSSLLMDRGNPSGILFYARDITAKKETEEALRESEERFRTLADAALEGIMIHDRGIILDCNPQFAKLFGYKPEEIIGKNGLEFMVTAESRDTISRWSQNGSKGMIDIIAIKKDGTRFYGETTSTTILWQGKLHSIVQMNDITERKRVVEALSVTEEKYRIVSEMAKDGIAIVQNHKLVYVNPSLARMAGYSVEELTGSSFLRFVAPESVVDLLGVVKNSLLGKPVPEIFSTRIRHRDGHTIEIEANGTSISWEGKKALLGIIRDVTERKQAENALKESQDLYQTLAESSPDMIYLIDREGYIRYVNSKAAQQFRQKPTEIMGKRLVDMFPADIARHHMEGITRTFTTGKPGFSEIFESFPTRDIWINARLNPVKDSKGVLTHVLGISTDITDHKRAEQVLRDDEAKLRTIFESVQAGIVIIDPVSHKIVDINSVASRLIGAPKERIIGQVCHQFICPAAEGNCPICDLNQVVDNSERILLTMNQKEVPILKTVVPIMLNGRQHLLESFIDISELKRAEEELLALNRDLEGKVLERTESLNNSLKDKELLLREIHHRVKNNLQIIISLLNLQSRYITDEKTLAAIRESQNRVKAMALVHEKLYQSADIAKINLDDYVQFLGNSLFQFYGMRGKGITFTTAIPEITLDINTAIPIGLIINELVSNSLKYAFPNGKRGEISIGIKREDHRVTILFKDTGTGIPADFDWRNAKSLGLRLVVSLVEQLSGMIELDRAAGTTYTIVVNEKG